MGSILEVQYSADLFCFYQTIAEIFQAGYSRIPVYEKDKNDIIGLILAKDLIFIDPEVCCALGLCSTHCVTCCMHATG